MSRTILWPRTGQKHDVRIADITEDLTENCKRLFLPPYGPVEIAVAEVTPNSTEKSFLESDVELQEHLSTHHPQDLSCTSDAEDQEDSEPFSRSSFFILEPAYAWSHLPVTRDGVLALLAGLDVFPDIYRSLRAFGRKGFPKDEGFASFDSATTLSSFGQWACFESCYLLKYIGRKEDHIPGAISWSIRHALIYQKVNIEAKKSSHILVRLPERVKRQVFNSIKEEGSESKFSKDWTRLHMVCFSSIDAEWRNMVNYLDEKVTNVFDRVIMSGVDPTKLNEFDSVHSSTRDLKTLQFLSDQARRVITAIELNINTMKCLREKIDFLANIDSWAGIDTGPLPTLSVNLAKSQQEHQFALKNASAVLARTTATSQHLRDTISLRNGEISKLNAETANQNTLAIAQLADLSGRETHVVKTLTVLALLFVPASFVATFFKWGSSLSLKSIQ